MRVTWLIHTHDLTQSYVWAPWFSRAFVAHRTWARQYQCAPKCSAVEDRSVFRKRATNYTALLRKMTVKIRHPMTLRNPVPVRSRTLSCWRSRCSSLWSSLRRSLGYFAVDFWKLRVPSMDSEESAGDFPSRFFDGEPQRTHTYKHIHAYIYIHTKEGKIDIHTLTWIHQKMNTFIPAWNIQKT